MGQAPQQAVFVAPKQNPLLEDHSVRVQIESQIRSQIRSFRLEASGIKLGELEAKSEGMPSRRLETQSYDLQEPNWGL